MENIYHCNIQLPFRFEFLPVTSTERLSMYDHPVPELRNFLLEHGIGIRHIEVFYIPAGEILPPHVDCDHFSNYCKMNFVTGGRDSKMHWYKLQTGANYRVMHKVESATKTTNYIGARPEDLDLVYSAEVGYPGLVNVGHFHSVTNGSYEDRRCFSIMLTHADRPGQNMDWDVAVKKLQKYRIG